MIKRTRMVEVEEYVASNGRAFKTAEECERYEDKLAAQTGCIIWRKDETLPSEDRSIEFAEYVVFKDAASLRWFNERSTHNYWKNIDVIPEALTYPVMFRYDAEDNEYINWEDEKRELREKIAALDLTFLHSASMPIEVDIAAVEPDCEEED